MNTVLKQQRMHRLELLQKSLDIATSVSFKLKGVTQLAKFSANLIRDWERAPLEEGIPNGVLVSKRSELSWKTLLRGDYRIYLDAWVETHNTAKKSSWSRDRIRTLEIQLVKLRAQYELLHAQTLEWQDVQSSPPQQKEQIIEEAFKSIEILINHFSDMVAVHEGSLVSRSAARPTLISEKRFSAFLAWRAKSISRT